MRHRDVVAEQLGDGGEHLDGDAGLVGAGDQLAHELVPGAGDGDEQGVGPHPGCHRHQARAVAEDADAPVAEVALGGVVVEEADGEVGAVGVAEHGVDDLGAAVARAEHQDPGGGGTGLAGGVAEDARRDAGRSHEDEGHEAGHDGGAGGDQDLGVVDADQDHQRNHRGGEGRAGGERHGLVEAAQAPAAPVEGGGVADDQLHDHGQDHDDGEAAPADEGDAEVVADE